MKNTYIILGIVIIGGLVTSAYWHNISKTMDPDGTDTIAHEHEENLTNDPHSSHSAMAVSSEREFIELMIPHHLEAIEASRILLMNGATTPEVRELAQNIINAQEKEVADMRTWYQDWYGAPHKLDDRYNPMMRDLIGISGVAADNMFLEDMILHHESALEMANQVAPYITHEEILLLTRAIIETQAAEIETMRTLLRKI